MKALQSFGFEWVWWELDSIAVSLFEWSKQICTMQVIPKHRRQYQNNYPDTETRRLVLWELCTSAKGKSQRWWKSLSAGGSLSQTEKNSLGVCSVTVVCTAQCWDCAVYTLLRLCGVYTAETLCTMYSETPTVWGKVRVLWIDTSNNLNYWSKFDQNLINSWSSNTFSRKIEATHFI